MARNFTITTPAETVRVGPDGRGEMTFTVTNVSGFPTRGLAKIAPLGNTSPEWLTMTDVEREFPAAGVHQFSVTGEIPPGTPAGRYTWRFDVVTAVKSGESSDAGPTVAFEVGATEPKKKGIPWWVWVAIAVGAIVLAVVAYLLFKPAPTPPPPEIVKVEVPELEGKALASAILTLQKAELTPLMKAKFVPVPGRRLNRVEDQDPDAGTMVEKGTVVTIVVVQRRGLRPKLDGPDVQQLSPEALRNLNQFSEAVEKAQ